MTPLFDHERLAKLLIDSLKLTATGKNLPFSAVTYINKNKISFNAKGDTYQLDLKSYQLSRENESPPNRMESKSPDGKWIAYTEKYNLFIKSTETGEVKQLSTAG